MLKDEPLGFPPILLEGLQTPHQHLGPVVPTLTSRDVYNLGLFVLRTEHLTPFQGNVFSFGTSGNSENIWGQREQAAPRMKPERPWACLPRADPGTRPSGRPPPPVPHEAYAQG